MSAREYVEVSPAMLKAGVEALREETFAAPQEELASLIYMAIQYQRRRECASATISRK
jgi:hypothetical protein